MSNFSRKVNNGSIASSVLRHHDEPREKRGLSPVFTYKMDEDGKLELVKTEYTRWTPNVDAEKARKCFSRGNGHSPYGTYEVVRTEYQDDVPTESIKA